MPEPICHRLFFAIRPPPGPAAEISELRDAVRSCGSPVRDERLHTTIFLFDDYPAFPEDLAERAMAAAGGIAAAPFRVLFDQIIAGSGPTLLMSSETPPAFAAFQERLAAALADVGLAPRSGWSFRPHVTLLYGNRHVLDEPVDPISWLVEDFVLIHSLVGATRHIVLAQWPLTAERDA